MVGMPPQMMNTPPAGPSPMGSAPPAMPPSTLADNGIAMSGAPNPYNSMGNQPPSPPTDDDEAGSVPANTDPGHATIIRAMHNAYKNKGVNPMNSHPEMAKKWERAWKDKANRDALKAAKQQEMQSVMKVVQKLKSASPSPVPSSSIRR